MSRAIMPRWKYPRQDILEQVYPAGKPPFDPFPNVTDLVNAHHCPRAIYHKLQHAEDGACIPQTATAGWRSGDTFHGFIALLKNSIIEGKLTTSENVQNMINKGFYLFTNSYLAQNIDNPDLFWKQYIEPWIRRKTKELVTLGPESKNFFELSVSSARVSFKTKEGGTRNYPLTGRIDEIDLNEKRIIDRTLRSDITLKKYQVWLLWKILCSINRAQYPEYLKGVDFTNFELIVETPSSPDVTVEKNNPDFEYTTHYGYSWINDLTFDPKAVAEAYLDNSCSIDNKKECGLAWMCYAHKWPFPMARGEMRRKFKDMYRALLFEKIWGYDLFQYRFLMLSKENLERHVLICQATLVQNSQKNNTFQVKINNPSQTGLIWTKETDDTDKFLLIFGNFSIGQRHRATIKRISSDLFSVKIEDPNPTPLFSQPLIATTGTDFIVFEEHPTYLITGLQKDLHNLELRGAKNPDRAAGDSKIQIIEAIFGGRPIVREGVENSE